MAAIVVIGDELNTLGFSLAGVQTINPAPAELHAAFAQALADAAMVVLSRRCADMLGAAPLRQAMRRESPLLVVLPEITAPRADSGVAARMRGVLGIES